MKKIRTTAIICTIIFGVCLVLYSFLAFSDELKLSAFLGAMSGIIATIAFGFWISYLFQRENDKRIIKKDNEFINKIRQKELRMAQFLLSNLVREFYSGEEILIKKVTGLKPSFSKNKIDIENLTINYFAFKEIENKPDKYLLDDDKKMAKMHIDTLYMKDKTRPIFIEGCRYDSSRTLQDFMEFNKECIRLYKAMNELNLHYNLEIFKDDEIKALMPFSNEIGIGYFTNFNPPFEIIEMFKIINGLTSFLDCDFIPAYKKPGWMEKIMNYDTKMQEEEKRIKELTVEYTKKAKAVLKKKKKRAVKKNGLL